MKRFIITTLLMIAAITASHYATLYTMEIETDGDGDSAIVTTWFGSSHLFGINGYEIS